MRPSCIDNNMMGFIPHKVMPAYVLRLMGGIDFGRFVNPGAVPSINESQVGQEKVVCPPFPEQHAIVRYLDHADRRIRRYVAAKRKLIGLLEEERQAVVNHAVTRGLDPSVRLKPSGVEWLGDVPEHWEVRRLSRLSGILRGKFTHRVRGGERVRLAVYLKALACNVKRMVRARLIEMDETLARPAALATAPCAA